MSQQQPDLSPSFLKPVTFLASQTRANVILRGLFLATVVLMLFVLTTSIAQAQEVGLGVDKSTDTTLIESGVPFEYTVSYRCASIDEPCVNATLSDVLDGNLEYIPDSATRTVHVADVEFIADGGGTTGGEVLWSFVNPLPAGASGVLHFLVQFKVGTLPETVAENTVTMTADNGLPATSDPTLTTVLGQFEMEAEKSGGPAVAGYPTDFSLNVCSPDSSGGVPLLTPVITDTIPPTAHFVDAEGIENTDWVLATVHFF